MPAGFQERISDMTRGRKALPDEIKLLKGNPGKRKIVIAEQKDTGPVAIDRPFYLSKQQEQRIFARITADLNQARFVRKTDTHSVARYAAYLSRWASIKQRLDKVRTNAEFYESKSKHGKLLRVHPLFASMLKIEPLLLALEDRIGLNPSARQAILRGIINMPQLPPGDLFGDGAQKPQAPEAPASDAAPPSAMGFLN